VALQCRDASWIHHLLSIGDAIIVSQQGTRVMAAFSSLTGDWREPRPKRDAAPSDLLLDAARRLPTARLMIVERTAATP